jgi:hypothetical protein
MSATSRSLPGPASAEPPVGASGDYRKCDDCDHTDRGSTDCDDTDCDARYYSSMKMHSPGHSSTDSCTASSMPSGTTARPA